MNEKEKAGCMMFRMQGAGGRHSEPLPVDAGQGFGGRPKANFGPLMRRQLHSPDVCHSQYFLDIIRSLKVRLDPKV